MGAPPQLMGDSTRNLTVYIQPVSLLFRAYAGSQEKARLREIISLLLNHKVQIYRLIFPHLSLNDNTIIITLQAIKCIQPDVDYSYSLVYIYESVTYRHVVS